MSNQWLSGPFFGADGSHPRRARAPDKEHQTRVGEEKAKWYARSMAHRPDPSPDNRPFTQAELKELHLKMTLLSRYHVIKAYREAHERCRMNGEVVPHAKAVQELVTAWRVLRESRRSR